MRAYLAVLALVGCGDDGGGATTDAASGDGSSSVDATMSGGCGASSPTGVINGTINVALRVEPHEAGDMGRLSDLGGLLGGAGEDALEVRGVAGDGPDVPAGEVGRGAPLLLGPGTDRTYLLVIPASYDPSRAYPLIFAWHGRTGNSAGARSYFGIEAQSGTNAIVVYPQGLPVSSTPSDTGWELGENQRDVAFFDALYTKLASDYCTGTTFSMGHSFGGYMSNSLACYRGGSGAGKVRAIASIAGGGPFGACSGDPVSAAIIHGTADVVVLPTEGNASRDKWRTEGGCATTSMATTPSPCVAYDGCTAGLAVRYCEHSDTAFSGHGWPTFAAPAAWQLFQDSI